MSVENLIQKKHDLEKEIEYLKAFKDEIGRQGFIFEAELEVKKRNLAEGEEETEGMNKIRSLIIYMRKIGHRINDEIQRRHENIFLIETELKLADEGIVPPWKDNNSKETTWFHFIRNQNQAA